MDFDIFVSEDGETGQPYWDYADLDSALFDFYTLVRSGEYQRVTLYRFDAVIKNWEAR
jgi:hypothetical protein